MGQRTSSNGLRLHFSRSWDSYWYHPISSKLYSYNNQEDIKLLSSLKAKFKGLNYFTNLIKIYRKKGVLFISFAKKLFKLNNKLYFKRKKWYHGKYKKSKYLKYKNKNYYKRYKYNKSKLKPFIRLRGNLKKPLLRILRKRGGGNISPIKNIKINRLIKFIKNKKTHGKKLIRRVNIGFYRKKYWALNVIGVLKTFFNLKNRIRKRNWVSKYHLDFLENILKNNSHLSHLNKKIPIIIPYPKLELNKLFNGLNNFRQIMIINKITKPVLFKIKKKFRFIKKKKI